jgi:hypothetical protein
MTSLTAAKASKSLMVTKKNSAVKKGKVAKSNGSLKAVPMSATSFKTLLKAGEKGETPERRVLCTSELASHILTNYNTANRSLNDAHLQSIVRDIKNGNWIDGTGTMVSFSKSGELIDGQHRLAAIAKAKKPLPLSFKFGLDEAAKRVIDTGRKRTYADLIAMTEGLDAKYKTERASVTRLLFGFLHDQERPHVYTNNNKPTQSDLFGVSEEFGDAVAEAVSTTMGPGHVQRVVIGSYAAFVFLLAKHSEHGDRAEEFFHLLGSGANMDADNPIMVVRNRLLTRDEFRSQKTKDRTIGLLVKAWNLWVNGEKVSSKMHSPDHVLPVAGLQKLGKRKLYS